MGSYLFIGFLWLLKKVTSATFFLLVSQVLLLQAMLLVSRRLGVDGYGLYGLAMTANFVVAPLMQWGMEPLLTVKFAHGSANENRALFGVVLRQRQLFGFAIFVCACALLPVWPRGDQTPLLFLGILDGVLVGLTFPALFDARRSSALWQFFALVRHAIYLGTILLAFTLFPHFVSPLGVVALHALCIFPEIALEQVWLRKTYGTPRWPAPVAQARTLIVDALPMAVALVASQLLKALGVPVLWATGHRDEVGAYYLSSQCSVVATSALGAALSVLHAQLALASRDPVRLRAQVWRATAICTAVGVAGSLAGCYAALWVPFIFGAKFAPTVGILQIDIWRVAGILAAAPLLSLLICTGRLRAFALVHVAGLFGALALAAWRVNSDGTRGVALAVAAGHGLVFVLALILALKVAPNKRA